MSRVFIVGKSEDLRITSMFTSRKWEVVTNISDAELVQFTGGEDVSPSFYGQPSHANTYSNPERDRYEKIMFTVARFENKAMAGICRGAQFLHVMCGGSLWQDIDGHTSLNGHEIIDLNSGEVLKATSTHHQEMIPTKDCEVLAQAFEATQKVKMAFPKKTIHSFNKSQIGDTEAVWHDQHKCLCFQPHPEYPGFNKLTDLYFQYIETYCLAKEVKDNDGK
jgi:gamma-glutamyl-gamma-aminobutyrate hydrolase PuuD